MRFWSGRIMWAKNNLRSPRSLKLRCHANSTLTLFAQNRMSCFDCAWWRFAQDFGSRLKTPRNRLNFLRTLEKFPRNYYYVFLLISLIKEEIMKTRELWFAAGLFLALLFADPSFAIS